MADEWDQFKSTPPSGDEWDQYKVKVPPQPLSWLDQVGHVVKGAWDNLAQTGQGMVDLGSAVGNAAMGHPGQLVGLVKGAGAASDAVRQAAEDAFKKGDYLGGIRHALGYALPLVGPALDALGNEAGSGQPGALAHAVGGSLALGGQLAAPEVLAEAGPAIAAAASKIPNPLRASENVPIIRAYGLTDPKLVSPIPGMGEVTPIKSALSDVAEASKSTGTPATNNEGFIVNAKAAMQQNRAVWQQWLDRGAGRTTGGQPIIAATDDSLAETLPAAARTRILNDAQRVYGGDLSVEDLERLRLEKNGELAPFYSRDDNIRAAAEQAGARTGRSQALLEAQAHQIRDLQYNLMDPENAGAGPAEVQHRYGAISQLHDSAWENRLPIMAEKPVSTATGVGRVGVGILDIPGKVVSGRIEDALSSIRHPMSGPTDPLIKAAMNSADPFRPLPTPSGLYPTGNPQRALPGPGPRLGNPMGTQYDPMMGERPTSTGGMPPEWQQNVWRGAGAPRQLPPGSVPFTQGTSVPDTTLPPTGRPNPFAPRQLSAGRAPFTQGTVVPDIVGGQRTPYNAGLLEAGEPGSAGGAIVLPLPGDAYPSGSLRGEYPQTQLGPEPPPQQIPPTINRQEAGPGYGSPVFPKEKVAEFAKMNDLTPEKALAELAKEGYVVK